MKSTLLFIPLFFLVLLSCKKDDKVQEPRAIVAVPDNIYYRNIEPDLIVHNTSNKDTVFSYNIDIDSNQVNDFMITSRTYSYVVNNAAQLVLHFGDISISGKTTSNKIYNLIPGPGTPCYPGNGVCPFVNLLDSTQSINLNSNFSNGFGFLFYFDMHTDFKFTGNKYIGITLENKYFGWIKVEGFGTLNKIAIKEIAINKTPYNSILAGQKQ